MAHQTEIVFSKSSSLAVSLKTGLSLGGTPRKKFCLICNEKKKKNLNLWDTCTVSNKHKRQNKTLNTVQTLLLIILILSNRTGYIYIAHYRFVKCLFYSVDDIKIKYIL